MSAKKHFSNIDQLKAGAFLSFFQMALGSLVVLFYTPVMIRELGKSEYGLYNTVASTVSMLSILNLGLAADILDFTHVIIKKRITIPYTVLMVFSF